MEKFDEPLFTAMNPTTINNEQEELAARIAQYNSARDWLLDYRWRRFPTGKKVIVNVPGRYSGPGVSRTGDNCPADQIAVELPNGNTWWYPISKVEVAP